MTLDKQILWVAGIVGGLITIWRGIDMVRKSGERHQELIDSIKALQKNEVKQDEIIKELDRKLDKVLADVLVIKSKVE